MSCQSAAKQLNMSSLGYLIEKRLPNEVLTVVFSFLDFKILNAVLRTSKRWNSCADHMKVWEAQCDRMFDASDLRFLKAHFISHEFGRFFVTQVRMRSFYVSALRTRHKISPVTERGLEVSSNFQVARKTIEGYSIVRCHPEIHEGLNVISIEQRSASWSYNAIGVVPISMLMQIRSSGEITMTKGGGVSLSTRSLFISQNGKPLMKIGNKSVGKIPNRTIFKIWANASSKEKKIRITFVMDGIPLGNAELDWNVPHCFVLCLWDGAEFAVRY